MKIMSKRDVSRTDEHLEMVKFHLLGCLKRMEGKYGTHEAVSNLKCALTFINQCISNDKYYKEFYQQFKSPPDTPKSRRLGWHKKGANND